jgi:hypothetical protein
VRSKDERLVRKFSRSRGVVHSQSDDRRDSCAGELGRRQHFIVHPRFNPNNQPNTTMSRKKKPLEPSIDSFRPASYWEDNDPLAAILRNVSSTARRQMIRDHWDAGTLDELDPALLADETDPQLREFLGRLHPAFMGGEYLPRFRPTEVEIARIDLESVTADVISIRARREPGETGVYYRIVDEYRTRFECEPEWSNKPLTQRELVDLIGDLGVCYNEENLEYSDVESLRHFTTVSSSFYPDLFDHFDRIHAQWVEEILEQAAKEAAEDQDEDED